MNVALVTMLDDAFYPGFQAFITSLLKSNPEYDITHDLIVLDCGLSRDTIEKISILYPRVIIRNIKKDLYTNVSFDRIPDRVKATVYKLEFFNIEGYDRLIFIDSDCLVLDSLEELEKIELTLEKPLAAVPAYNAHSNQTVNSINSGVLVYNRKDTSVYNQLVKAMNETSTVLPDQTIINTVLSGRIQFLPKRFNVEKRMADKGRLNVKDYHATMDNTPIAILHFVGEKPWYEKKHEQGYNFLYLLWSLYYEISVRRSRNAKPGLERLCKYVKNTIGSFKMAEIGSYAGDSGSVFAQYAKYIYCIDPWKNDYDEKDKSSSLFPMELVFRHFVLKMKRFVNYTHLRITSEEASKNIRDEALDMVYIDANHTYESVIKDLNLWGPKVRAGGIVSGHDLQDQFPGVKKALLEYFHRLPDMVFEDTSWAYKK